MFVGAVAAVAGGPDDAGGFNRVRKSASGLEGTTTGSSGWLLTGSTDSGPFFSRDRLGSEIRVSGTANKLFVWSP